LFLFFGYLETNITSISLNCFTNLIGLLICFYMVEFTPSPSYSNCANVETIVKADVETLLLLLLLHKKCFIVYQFVLHWIYLYLLNQLFLSFFYFLF
jgi:hypothetical protein